MAAARILILALALMHVVGLADLVLDDACGEVCSDAACGDGCGDDCLPGVACRCHCPSAMPLLGGVVQTVAPVRAPAAVAASPRPARMHASPDPREILHVPKPSV